LMTYLLLSASASSAMILVHRATCRGCSSAILCRSAATSHRCGGARPVSDSYRITGESVNELEEVLGRRRCPYLDSDLLIYARLFFLYLLFQFLDRCCVGRGTICFQYLDVSVGVVSATQPP
jgi:hypothetical protein